MLRRKPAKVVVVVATRQRAALEALNQAMSTHPEMERREALTTGGLYQALKGAHLVVTDVDDLTESANLNRERLIQVLANTVAVSGSEFARNPVEYLDRARVASGLTGILPPRSVAFAGLSGGVGKSTLSLSLARFFRQKTGLPTAVIELSCGPSGILALLSKEEQDWNHIYEVVSQGKA